MEVDGAWMGGSVGITVKPPIIPGGREQQKAGNNGRMETGGVPWQRGARHNRLNRVTFFYAGEENRNICVI